MKMKERRALAAARLEERRNALEQEALENGVVDVDGYVRARIEPDFGLGGADEVDDMPDDPYLPAGQTLH